MKFYQLSADYKLKDMSAELTKSQQIAKKYQQLYEMEKQKMPSFSHPTAHSPAVTNDTEGRLTPRMPNQSSYTFLGGNQRVNDVIRKNEVCYGTVDNFLT